MSASLLISAYSPAQFVRDDTSELVFVGKSNVGKSSVINALLNRRNLAYVGKTPGKTRCINFYQINDSLRFVDVPGYGYAKRSQQEAVDYDTLMDAYFKRKHIKGIVMLMDGKVGPTQDDMDMVEYLAYNHFPFIIFVNKCDKCNQSALQKTKNTIKQTFNDRYPIVYGSCNQTNTIMSLKTEIQTRFLWDKAF